MPRYNFIRSLEIRGFELESESYYELSYGGDVLLTIEIFEKNFIFTAVLETVGTYHLDLIPIPRSIDEFLLFWLSIEKRVKFGAKHTININEKLNEILLMQSLKQLVSQQNRVHTR